MEARFNKTHVLAKIIQKKKKKPVRNIPFVYPQRSSPHAIVRQDI